jgi:tripartite-type tricarboxylate transporter receptor subunit TctC
MTLGRQYLTARISMLGLIVFAAQANGLEFPTKPIRIVTSEAGGGTEFAARMIAQGLTAGWGQQAIVDGRGAFLAMDFAARAAPDGYTLLVAGGSFWTGPLLRKLTYDPVRDFLPISLTNTAPSVLVVHPSLPVKSAKELIALAKARPGDLNYSSPSTGSAVHLAAELFKSMAGVNIVRIGYRGSGPATIALISGEVQLAFPAASGVMPHVRGGKLRALGLTSAEPSALLPDLPTIAGSGLPGYESVVITGIYAPAKTPSALISRLNQEIVRFLRTPEAKDKFFSVGAEAVGSSPEQLAAKMKSVIARMDKLIKDTGIGGE